MDLGSIRDFFKTTWIFNHVVYFENILHKSFSHGILFLAVKRAALGDVAIFALHTTTKTHLGITRVQTSQKKKFKISLNYSQI